MKLGSYVHLMKVMCIAHVSTLPVQCQGHIWRSNVWAFVPCLLHISLVTKLPWWGVHLTQVSWKSFKSSWRYGADTKSRVKRLTFYCDLEKNLDLMAASWLLHIVLIIWTSNTSASPLSRLGDREWTGLKMFKPLTFKRNIDPEPVWYGYMNYAHRNMRLTSSTSYMKII